MVEGHLGRVTHLDDTVTVLHLVRPCSGDVQVDNRRGVREGSVSMTGEDRRSRLKVSGVWKQDFKHGPESKSVHAIPPSAPLLKDVSSM